MKLDGYTWTFEAGKNEFTGVLTHPFYGVVWDEARGSLAHELPSVTGICRCRLTHILDVKDLVDRVKAIRDSLLDLTPEPPAGAQL